MKRCLRLPSGSRNSLGLGEAYLDCGEGFDVELVAGAFRFLVCHVL